MPHPRKNVNADGSRKTLVQQVSEVKGDAAYHSGRIIGEVDAMNFKLEAEKKKRRDQVAADLKEIKHIADEQERLMVRYRPLAARLNERKAEREHLRQVLAQTHDKVHGFIGQSRGTKQSCLTEQLHLRAKAAKAELKSCRGYSCDTGTTPDRFGQTAVQRSGRGGVQSRGRLRTAGSSISNSGRISRSMSKSSVSIGVRHPQR